MKIFFFSAGSLLLCLVGLRAPVLAQQPTSPCGPEPRVIPLPEDTLLQVNNRDVTRIFANVNGHTFKLAAAPSEVARSANAFPIPPSGEVINIASLMKPENNCYAFSLQGAPGTSAEFIFANTLIAGAAVAFEIRAEALEPLPEQLALLQSYPNPFRTATTITYEIPASRTTGLPVRLVVYDALGRRVRVLVDDYRFPGTFTVRWNPARHREAIAPGTYFCRLMVGDQQQTIKLVYLR